MTIGTPLALPIGMNDATPNPETTMKSTRRSLNVPSLVGRLCNLLESRGVERARLAGYDVPALIRIGLKSGLVSKADLRAYLTM
jgi:hypothetical protein